MIKTLVYSYMVSFFLANLLYVLAFGWMLVLWLIIPEAHFQNDFFPLRVDVMFSEIIRWFAMEWVNYAFIYSSVFAFFYMLISFYLKYHLK